MKERNFFGPGSNLLRSSLQERGGFIHAPSSSESGAGFTLIELLVVIAIISLMGAISLVGITQSKKEAQDKGIVRDLDKVRKEVESFHVDQGTYEGICAPEGTLTEKGQLGTIEDSIEEKHGEVKCINTASEYAVSSSLNRGGYWCVDSEGTSHKIDSQITGPECPR